MSTAFAQGGSTGPMFTGFADYFRNSPNAPFAQGKPLDGGAGANMGGGIDALLEYLASMQQEPEQDAPPPTAGLGPEPPMNAVPKVAPPKTKSVMPPVDVSEISSRAGEKRKAGAMRIGGRY